MLITFTNKNNVSYMVSFNLDDPIWKLAEILECIEQQFKEDFKGL